MRSHVFNGIQPSNDRCVPIDGQVTTECGQGTTLIDCVRGLNDNVDFSDLSNYFIWNETTLKDQKVSLTFRFDTSINISRISMFFWNSPNNSIIVPDVTMWWEDYTMSSFNKYKINYSPPNRMTDGLYTMNIRVARNVKLQHLTIVMNNSKWTFLSEVQLCGE